MQPSPGAMRAARRMRDTFSVGTFESNLPHAAQVIEEETHAGELLAALTSLHGAINAIRHDLGTKHPALSEAWLRAGMTIVESESR